jgi:hypothetical protein
MFIQHGCFGGASLKKRIPKEFLGAFKAGHRHAAREYIDEDLAWGLLRLLNEGRKGAREALEWLTQFNNEYYKCVFTMTLADFHENAVDRRERYQAQNQRYADVLAKVPRATIDVDFVETESEEDALIAMIDLKREIEKATKQ